ncbi:MAG: FAD-dependent oxidoreductase, partial [Acidimicrobiales bacterium]
MSEPVDVIVIGLGPGGQDAAERLAEAGLRVVGIDGGLVGGECPYWGCVPSKMMIRAADLLAEGSRVPGMAGAATVRPDWAPVARRIREEATDSWDDTVAVERFEGKGGRFERGWGRLEGPGQVSVGDRTFEAGTAVVIDAGTRPSIPPVDGLAATPYWTNHQAVETEEVPASLAVLGGGAIGVEFAQVFSRFGSAVTMLEATPRLLGPEEPEAGQLLEEVFAAEGIEVRTGAAVASVDHDGRRFTLDVGGSEPVVAERLLVATGRHAELARLNVSSVGLDD